MLKLKGEMRGAKGMKDEVRLTPLQTRSWIFVTGTSFQGSWFKISVISIQKYHDGGGQQGTGFKSPHLIEVGLRPHLTAVWHWACGTPSQSFLHLTWKIGIMSTYFKGLLWGFSKILHVKHYCLAHRNHLKIWTIVADILSLSGMIGNWSVLISLIIWSNRVYVFPDLFQKGFERYVLVSVGLSHMTYAF